MNLNQSWVFRFALTTLLNGPSDLVIFGNKRKMWRWKSDRDSELGLVLFRLVSLLELEFGVRVFIRALTSSKISGLFAFDEKIGACILLNKNHPRERRAITAAHELGHLIATRTQPDVVELRAVPQTREEKFAAAFSYALNAGGIRSKEIQ